MNNNSVKQTDISTLKQKTKNIIIKAEVLNDNMQTTNRIDGAIISGNYTVSSDSNVRRTCNLEILLDKCDMKFNEYIYFCYYIKIYVGYYSFFARETLYYNLGIYCFDSNSYTYDAVTNTLSLSLSDMMVMLDAEHRGMMYGTLTPGVYALYDELQGENAGKRKPHEELVLRNIVQGMLDNFGVKNYLVEEIGQYTHTPIEEETWNELPYDLEFQKGTGFLEILDSIKELYPFYEMYYDVDGVFHFKKKIMSEDDSVVLDESIINPLVISESCERNIYDVKNIIEIWGEDLNADRFAVNDDTTTMVTYSEEQYNGETVSVYNLKFDGFELNKNVGTEKAYPDNLLIGIKVPHTNTQNKTYIRVSGTESEEGKNFTINLSYGAVYNPLLSTDDSHEFIQSNELEQDSVYIFKYQTSINGFYLMGIYQVHALAVLTNGSYNDDYHNSEERIAWFKKEYNVNKVKFIIDEYSPFTIENIGRVHYIPKDAEYETLDADDRAVDAAEEVLWKKARRTDTLSLEMIMIPWLDVNQKIKYIPQNSTEPQQYIITSINGDFNSGKMTMEIMRFYNYYSYE